MRRFVIALVATIAVLLPAGSLVQAASCNGASHQAPTFSNGSANPGSGSSTTPITFSVIYMDNAGCIPTSLTVSVTGVGTFEMSTSGTNFTAGVTYLVTLAIPAGSHTYWFGAASGSGVGEQFATFTAVQPGAVVITNPTQAPTPVPPPSPPPVPQPVPVPPPVVQPPPPPPPTAPPATASPSASASSSPSSSPTTTPTEGAPSPTGPTRR